MSGLPGRPARVGGVRDQSDRDDAGSDSTQEPPMSALRAPELAARRPNGGRNVAEVHDAGKSAYAFDFELLVTNVSLVGPPGIRAREYWQNPSMAKWAVSASDPGETSGPTVTFQID